MRSLFISALLLLDLLLYPSGAGADTTVRIGVLSHRGAEFTQQLWGPTADYLTAAIPGHRFEVVPLGFKEIEPAVRNQAVDFVLANPAFYVNLEVWHRVSRIATLSTYYGGRPYNVFGGVLFVRADSPIRDLRDLKGKSFVAVEEQSLGGYEMALRELHAAGVDPQREFARVEFALSHDAVVRRVLEGAADVGTVRTGILESLEAAGTVDVAQIRVIHPVWHEDFPLRVSTRLYPEWPFGKLLHTSNELAQRVAIALLEMPPTRPAVVSGRYARWTIPLDYQPVHELLRELRLSPYDAPDRFTLTDVVARYWHWVVLVTLVAGMLVFLAAWVARLNRRLAKTKLRLERQHDLILDSVADGIYGVDTEGLSTFVNRAMERMTGWRAAEVVGRNQHAILHHTHADGSPHPAEECPVYATFRDNVPRFVKDDMFWRKDGTGFPVEYYSSPVRDERGATIGAVVVFRDISERKAAEQRERKHREDLAHVARVSTMGEMASGIAHELNQPLAAIVNYAQGSLLALESGAVSQAELADTMQRVAQQAQRAGDIIRQFRRFVRKDEAERAPADANALVRRVLLLLEPELRQEGVEVVLLVDQGLPAVRVQETQIEQVILNLVRNAMEAMTMHDGPERRLTIRTFEVSRELAGIEVTDTGPGFSADAADHLFEPFRTTKKQGMGLGLSISRSIVEAHGGELTAQGAVGRGATLRFTLPYAERTSNLSRNPP